MSEPFKFLMLGAMYENGGNTTQRFLDGHPQLYVYPFESQPGTRHVNDALSSMFPLKYRWPSFLMEASVEQDYRAIIDEECKVRARTPNSSKFKDWPFELNDDQRLERYKAHVARLGRSRPNNMEAFFRATFEAWTNFRASGSESVYVGYSPIIVVDADKILEDLPQAHFLHVVRNPWSAYADTKKRAVPLSLSHYMLGWTLNQYYALMLRKKYPERLHIVRIEDVMADSHKALGDVLQRMRLDPAESLRRVSWNGQELKQVYPWGTIRAPTPDANLATARELSKAEADEIRARTWQYLPEFGYEKFL